MKHFITLFLLFTLGNASADRPNIVLIMTDDQSWDSLAFMGGKVHTPRIDQMAEEGMFFSDFNVTSTVCSPSRYSFLTGRYAGRCQGERFMKEHPPGEQTQVENIGELEPDRWNLPKILQKNGYRTGFVGKAHVVRHDWLKSEKDSPLQSYALNADPRDPVVNQKMRDNHQLWCDEIKKYGFDLCGITPPDDYQMDGRSFKPALFGEGFRERKVLFGELGHARCVKTKDSKYIVVRYPGELQRKVEAGVKFQGFKGAELDRPYPTRNGHLGHYASEANPHYFEADQLCRLTNDPEEKQNVADNDLEIVKQMQGKLSIELKKFPKRPFGEFTR